MSQLIVPGVAFAIASSPVTFKVTRKVFGSWVSTFEGVATPAGLFLHTLFFLFILFLIGKFMPHLSGYEELTKEQKDALKTLKKAEKTMQERQAKFAAKPMKM